MTISVIGSGAFGTALAISLAGAQPVILWARDPDHAADMQKIRQNAKRLPGADFPDQLTATSDFNKASEPEVILLAVPLQQLRDVLVERGAALADKTLVACCKGMELKTGKGPVQIIQEEIPTANAAILTGPSFARGNINWA